MLLKTSGLVIREKVLSNDNRMLTILTGEYGVIKAFIRTSRKMRSSLAAAIDLFSYSDFLIFFNKDQYCVDGAETNRIFYHLREDLEKKNDPNVYNIAEMGMGMNPHCYFCGFMLEDEGVEGSVHIGIGTSITLGGTVKAACHYDLIMTGATVEADGVVLLKDGVLNKETILA